MSIENNEMEYIHHGIVFVFRQQLFQHFYTRSIYECNFGIAIQFLVVTLKFIALFCER